MRISTRSTVFVLALCAAFLPRDTAAQSDRPPDDKTLSPFFFVEGGDPAIDPLPLKDTKVEVAIAGVIADVTVRQVYENRGTRPIHARYVFPASTRAAVYGLTMTVGDVRTVARIRERSQAAREFERAKREGKSASLLEQSRPNVFTMKVANVLPGDTIAVELKYTELLVPTDGVYEFVYPTVVGPRYSDKREGQASPADEFVKAPYTRQGEAPRSDFQCRGRGVHGRAISGARVPIPSADRPLDRPRTRGDDIGRVRTTVGQSRFHPSVSAGRPGDCLGPAAVPRPGRELFPPHGGAATGRPSRRRATT